MGSYVSVARCQSDYGVNVTCTGNFDVENGTLMAGNYSQGAVPPNLDVAGIGVSVLLHSFSFNHLAA